MKGFKAWTSAIKILKGQRMKIAYIKDIIAKAITAYFTNLNLSPVQTIVPDY